MLAVRQSAVAIDRLDECGARIPMSPMLRELLRLLAAAHPCLAGRVRPARARERARARRGAGGRRAACHRAAVAAARRRDAPDDEQRAAYRAARPTPSAVPLRPRDRAFPRSQCCGRPRARIARVASCFDRSAVAPPARAAAALHPRNLRKSPMLGAIAKAIFGSSNDRYVKSLDKIVAQDQRASSRRSQAMTDEELAGADRASSASGWRTARRSTTSCPKRSPRCARRRARVLGSAISTCR